MAHKTRKRLVKHKVVSKTHCKFCGDKLTEYNKKKDRKLCDDCMRGR
jgi:hypothetical protein